MNNLTNPTPMRVSTTGRYWLVILGFAAMQIFTSCQKDSALVSTDDSTTKVETPHEKYLAKNKAKMKIEPRSGSKYSINDALELLNDGMNYIYCRPISYYLETKTFKDIFSIPVDGSQEIDESDMLSAMDDIALWAGNNYYDDVRTKEPLMFSFVRVYSSNSSYINVEATFAMEAGTPLATGESYPYEDSWIYGQWGSDVSEECNESELNLDAVDLFRRDLRTAKVYRNHNAVYYFTNPYVTCFSGSQNNCVAQEIPESYFLPDESYQDDEITNLDDITSGDNLEDLLLFANFDGFANFDDCLADDEMNFYYQSMANLIDGTLPSPVGNMVVGQIEVGYDAIFSTSTHIFHSMIVVLVKKIPVIEEEDFEPAPLPCC